jgi:hypothetical protein
MCISPAGSLQAIAQLGQGFADFQTGIANARFAKIEGQRAITAADTRAYQISRAGERFLSETISHQAASGVDVASSSAADVSAESARNIELERLNSLYAGRLKRWSKNAEASIHKRQATSALVNSMLGAGGTLLGSVDGGWSVLGKASGGIDPVMMGAL